MSESGSGTAAGETARYIEKITKELRDMAGKADLVFLRYLLDMAHHEAASIAGGALPGATREEAEGRAPPPS